MSLQQGGAFNGGEKVRQEKHGPEIRPEEDRREEAGAQEVGIEEEHIPSLANRPARCEARSSQGREEVVGQEIRAALIAKAGFCEEILGEEIIGQEEVSCKKIFEEEEWWGSWFR